MDKPNLTLFSSLLLGAVNVVFELDPDLPLIGLVPDEGMLQQLLGRRPLRVVLHQTALYEAEKLLGPAENAEEHHGKVKTRQEELDGYYALQGENGKG